MATKETNANTVVKTKVRVKNVPELVEEYPLANLKEHPKQFLYFRRPTAEELAALAEDMDRNGQREPGEVTPLGVLISGYKRAAARESQGKTHFRAVIRYDLAGQEDAIERRLIEGNENRRHLSRFERARLQYRMWELSSNPKTRKARGDINREIAATLDIDPRQVRKYVEVLRGPIELLRAMEDGRLKLTHALAVLKLPAKQSQPILAVLRDEPAYRKVKELVEQATSGKQTPKATSPAVLLKTLLKAGGELAKHKSALKQMTKGQLKSIAKLRKLLETVAG